MKRKLLSSAAIVTVLAVSASSAFAAGFAIREQSAQYQGSSFAGNAAGSGLSVMFWNPAGAANVSGPGINMESHFSLILPRSEVTVTSVGQSGITAADVQPGLAANPAVGPVLAPIVAPGVAADLNAGVDAAFAGAPAVSANIGRTALVGASYGSYQIAPNVFMGFGLNSPFGLVTEPDNQLYQGSVLARTTKLLTFNANPTLAFRVAPGITIGAGAQIQYGDGKLKFATGLPDQNSTTFKGNGWAFGGTAGVMFEPTNTTRIGVGYRSRLRQNLDGNFVTPGLSLSSATLGGAQVPVSASSAVDAEANIDLPDMVTVSLEQAISPALRLSATFEWANWSRLEELRLTSKTGGTIQTIETNWDDSYFYAVGLDYDLSSVITVRGGVAYEISPTSSPDKRLTSIPDADRFWLSAGGTYKWSESTSLDIAYTHVFVEDEQFVRTAPIGVELRGDVESSVDIISGSLKTRW